MLTMAENVIVSGANNRPHMLDKTQYSSWSSRILLYIKGKEHDKLLYDSVINGPFKYGTVIVLRTQATPATVRDKTYDELKTEANDIWDRVKLLIEGYEISLQERESKLYDEFDTFTSVPEETIHSYLNETQYHQQLSPIAQQYYSPPTQQQLNDVPMVQQRYYQAPVANHSSVVYYQSYQAPAIHQPLQASFPQIDSGLVVPSFLPSDDLIASLNKAMAFISTTFTSRYLPTNHQLRTSCSGARSNATSTWVNRNGGTNTAGQAKIIRCYNYQKLTEALEPRISLDEEQMAFLADNEDTVITGKKSQEIPTPAIFQTDDLDAFDSDCDEAPSASAILMANLFAYDLDDLLEVPTHDTYLDNQVIDKNTSSSAQQDALILFVIEEMSNQVAKCNEVDKVNKTVNESLTAELERYKDQIKIFEERQKFDLNDREKYIDSKLREHDALSMIDTEETLDLAEETRLKMHAKQNVPIAKDKKVNIAPIDYAALNKLSKHFVKHFMPQKQLSVEQAFWLPISKPIFETPPVQSKLVLKEIPRELPTIRLVKDSFNKMRSHVNDFDKVVTVRTKVTETEVDKCSVERKCIEIKKKELLLENDRLLELIISQDHVHIAVNSYAAIVDYQSMEKSYMKEYNKNLKLETELSKMNDMVDKAVYNELSNACSKLETRCIYLEVKLQQIKESFQNNRPCNNQDEFQEFFIINEFKAQLKAKESSINKLKAHIATLKGKSVDDYTINREAHDYYLLETKEHADSLCRKVEQARALNPTDEHLGYACKFTIRIQELLVYVTDTCPSSKVKRLKSSTSVSRSQPSGRPNRPLVVRLGWLQAHDQTTLSAHQLC
ncbi:hypothetical protein Tco_0783755 [Tanacetum coccineum]